MQYLTSIVLSLPLIGAYAIFAIGIVLIYRASRVLNIAHGAMAMVPGYLLYEMTRAGIPVVMGFPLGVAAGGLLGWGIERVFVRRLRSESLTAQTVGTVAALAILIALAAQIWGTSSLEAVRIFPEGRIPVGLSNLRFGEIGLFVVMLVVTGVLFLLIQRTDLGLKMRGSAESRLAASLMGVNPQRMTTLAWVMGGSLAALAGILLAAVTSLHPYVLPLQALPAFIAALIGGIESLPGALVGSAMVGITQGLVPVLGAFGRAQGAPQLLLALLAMVVMAARGAKLVAGDVRQALGEGGSERRRPPKVLSPPSTESTQRIEGRISGRAIMAVLGLGLAVSFPLFVPFSALGAANLAATYALVAVSLVILTGWVGQISLGHAALVGVGAYATGWATSRFGIPFPLSLPIAATVAAGLAALLGLVALRVRGLYLAVATLVFTWMASEFLFRQSWFIRYDQIPDYVVGGRTLFPSFDLSDRRVLYFIGWTLVAVAIYAAANMRASKTGRAFFAVRGSEIAAASLGIDVVRTKLLAFAASGAIAGAAGNLVMVMQRVVTADQFTFNASLFFLAIAVVGGLSSLGGAVASALFFAGLTEVFFRFPSVGAFLQLVSALMLAGVLLLYKGGLASIPGRLHNLPGLGMRTLNRAADRVGERIGRVASVGRIGSWIGRLLRSSVITRVAGSRWVAGLVERLRPAASRLSQAARRSQNMFPRPTLRGSIPVLRGVLTRNGGSPAGAEPPLDLGQIIRNGGRLDEANQGAASAPPVAILGQDVGAGNGQQGEAHRTYSFDSARLATPDIRVSGPRELRRALVEAEHVTVRFGGLVAVNDASLVVREGEITGLIGPNGAGKTTLFNAIAGYNSPSQGNIRLYGQDVTGFPVHLRARVGVARTFQLLQLFGELPVYDNLLVATHMQNGTGFFSHVFASDRALGEEREARERVEHVLQLLDMEDIAHKSAADLPFGVLRMVEVARALVTGHRVIMLDEPASGLDNTETDRLMDVLRFVRSLGVTMLLIEHDVRMVTGVSDYIYVLDRGRIIAEGTPDEIQRNPAVIAAYLGEPAKEVEAVS